MNERKITRLAMLVFAATVVALVYMTSLYSEGCPA